MQIFNAKPLLNVSHELAEGPLWNQTDHSLYWVNINQGELWRYTPSSEEKQCWNLEEPIGTFGFCKDGRIIAALKSGIYFLSLTENGVIKQKIIDPEPDTPNRFNDGKCAPDGRFLAGTMQSSDTNGTYPGGFYSIDPNGNCQTLLSGVQISNGLCFNYNGSTLYYIDSPTQAVTAYDYNLENGKLSNPRQVVTIPKEDGMPDGMTIDAKGNLWIALFGGGCVVCYDPKTGKQLAKVNLPAKKVTCCTFGGKNYETLYITTAWENSSTKEKSADPFGGNLFAADVSAHGLPGYLFGADK